VITNVWLALELQGIPMFTMISVPASTPNRCRITRRFLANADGDQIEPGGGCAGIGGGRF
jgi:hypothetical protein